MYILHQSFKHENRFAQLFDLGHATIVSRGENDEDMLMQQQFQAMLTNQMTSNRVFNRVSMAISEQEEDDDDATELLALNNDLDSIKKNRLYFFTKDSDYYTT